jgi:hypothetical protein
VSWAEPRTSAKLSPKERMVSGHAIDYTRNLDLDMENHREWKITAANTDGYSILFYVCWRQLQTCGACIQCAGTAPACCRLQKTHTPFIHTNISMCRFSFLQPPIRAGCVDVKMGWTRCLNLCCRMTSHCRAWASQMRPRNGDSRGHIALSEVIQSHKRRRVYLPQSGMR